MATTTTPRLGLNKQDDSDLNWGAIVNSGFDTADAALFLQSSDNAFTPAVDAVTFSGSGLDDATSGGTMAGARDLDLVVVIDSLGGTDTFKWSRDGGNTFEAFEVNLSAGDVALVDGVTITWAAVTGHTLGDQWSFEAHSGDPQDPNDIDGAGTPLTADYVGQRYYAELDETKWVATTTTSWILEEVLVQAYSAVNKNHLKNVSVDPDSGIITARSARLYPSIVQPGNILINGYGASDVKGGSFSDDPLADNGRIANADFWTYMSSNSVLKSVQSVKTSTLPAGLLPTPIPATHCVKATINTADSKFCLSHLVDPRTFESLAQHDYCSVRVWLAADNAGAAATLAKAVVALVRTDSQGSAIPGATLGPLNGEGVNPTLYAANSAAWVSEPYASTTLPALDWVEVFIPNILLPTPAADEALWLAIWIDVGGVGTSAVDDNLWILGAALCPENSARFVLHPPTELETARLAADFVAHYDQQGSSGSLKHFFFYERLYVDSAAQQYIYSQYPQRFNPYNGQTMAAFSGSMNGPRTKNLASVAVGPYYGSPHLFRVSVTPTAAGETVLHSGDSDHMLIDGYGFNDRMMHFGGTFTAI